MLAETALVVGLGGNVGGLPSVAERIESAVQNLSERWGGARLSSFYRSAPVGPVADQPEFLNAVAAFWPEVPVVPEKVLQALLALEVEFGRERLVPGGARTLDLDFLLYGQRVQGPEALELPHPRMDQRAFVLAPLCELFGEGFVLPSGARVGSLLASPEIAAQACERWMSD